MLKKNEDITLEISGYTSEGSGVGHYDGIAVFVPDAAQGDTVVCRIIKAKQSYAVGRLLRLITPSPDRKQSDCSVYSQCGGCVFRHITYDAELRLKQERVSDAIHRIGHLDIEPEPILGAKSIVGYRNKAQYPVAPFNSGVAIGFYAKRSHRVVDCKNCALQPQDFSVIRSIFTDFLKKTGVSAYNEETNRGLVRNLYMRKAFATGEIMVCVVINGTELPHYEELLAQLKTVPGFKTLVLNINTAQTNVVLGEKTLVLYGDGYISDVLCGLHIRLGALSFYQVNRSQAEVLYGLVREYAQLSADDTVLDLYCGTGTIGLSLARDIKKLIGVELIPEAIEDAKKNAADNNIANADFICSDAASAAEKLKNEGISPNTVIVDPPRKGCEPELLNTLCTMAPEKIVYVSCDPATLARDCEILTASGYKLIKLRPVDMFPSTAHVETVCLLSKLHSEHHIG